MTNWRWVSPIHLALIIGAAFALSLMFLLPHHPDSENATVRAMLAVNCYALQDSQACLSIEDFPRACAAGVGLACSQLWYEAEERTDRPLAMKWLRLGCKSGDQHACYTLASQRIKSNEGFSEQVKEILIKSCNKAYYLSCRELGNQHEKLHEAEDAFRNYAAGCALEPVGCDDYADALTRTGAIEKARLYSTIGIRAPTSHYQRLQASASLSRDKDQQRKLQLWEQNFVTKGRQKTQFSEKLASQFMKCQNALAPAAPSRWSMHHVTPRFFILSTQFHTIVLTPKFVEIFTNEDMKLDRDQGLIIPYVKDGVHGNLYLRFRGNSAIFQPGAAVFSPGQFQKNGRDHDSSGAKQQLAEWKTNQPGVKLGTLNLAQLGRSLRDSIIEDNKATAVVRAKIASGELPDGRYTRADVYRLGVPENIRKERAKLVSKKRPVTKEIVAPGVFDVQSDLIPSSYRFENLDPGIADKIFSGHRPFYSSIAMEFWYSHLVQQISALDSNTVMLRSPVKIEYRYETGKSDVLEILNTCQAIDKALGRTEIIEKATKAKETYR